MKRKLSVCIVKMIIKFNSNNKNELNSFWSKVCDDFLIIKKEVIKHEDTLTPFGWTKSIDIRGKFKV